MRRRTIVRKGLAPVAGLAMVAGLLTGVTALPATAMPETDATDEATGPAESTASTGADGGGLVIETEGTGTGLWVVQLEEPSLATYDGGIDGLVPTSPQITGAARLDVEAPASTAYLDHLAQRQDGLADDIDDALGRDVDIAFRYRTVVNGLAVEIGDDEAAALADLPGVAAVYRDVEYEPQTDVSHDVIHSPAIWNGETGDDVGTRGEGVVVGIIDSGINPSHPSFAATDGDGYTHTNPYGSGNYVGVCDPDHPDHEDICNDKLIGAWNFHPTAPDAQDDDDHGSHVASTVAGNVHEATFAVDGDEFTRTIQGVAPRANIVSYLVCSPSCPGTSSVAAVEQAIIDGVDVLNYSISGAVDPWSDIVDRAFLEAFNAGIFVAAAAGNDGPGAGTTAHVGPWNAAVAATTMSRGFVNLLDVTGPSPVPAELTDLAVTPGDGTTIDVDIDDEIIDAHAVDPANVEGCAAFPAGSFDGALALIDRGACTFAEKVNNAAAAGATGVVVSNNVAGPPTPMGALESTTIPAVMIEMAGGTALRSFLADHADANPTVHIAAATAMVIDDDWSDIVAGFSSRGPARFDVATPTFAAPGVNVLAAAAEGDVADRYAVLGGTSMASPHAAGSGALMAALHPEWSPAQIQSALATTARSTGLVKEDGVTPADAYDIGAGQLDLAAAGTAGLVLDETHSDFLAANPNTGGDPRTLNVPFAVDDECAGTCTFTRTFESVAAVEATYTADVTAPEGLTVTVEPATFTVVPGAAQTVEITVDTAGAEARTTAFGEVRFTTDATHANGAAIAAAHLPLMITPVAVAPAITLEPGRIDADQGVDEVTAHTLTVGNTGNADLNWSVYADEPVRTPRGPVTTIDTVDRPGTLSGDRDLNRAADTGGEPADVVVPERPAADGELTQTITHSQSQAIVSGNSVACGPDDGATTSDNAFLRTYTLADFGIEGDFDVSEVEFGIEAINGSPVDLTVNVYTMIDPNGALTYANLENIGTATQTFEPQALTLATVPVTGTAPAGSTLVVEISAPDLSGVSGFWPGSNNAGQTAPSYLSSTECGITEPTDLAGIGFPGMHVVMNVTGQTEAPVCAAPGETPWLAVDPTAGTVAPAGTEDVAVTFDSTGLAHGTHEASLCLQSNDPRRPLAVVPLTLQVGEQPVIDVQPESLDITQDAGTIAPHTVTVGNTGEGVLDWAAAVEADACGGGQSVPWMSAQPASGTVDPGGSSDLTVTVDTNLLDAGVHTATLCLTSNDPVTPEVAVPVAVTVNEHEDPHVPAHTELPVPGQPDDQTGNAVAIDGDTAVVGAFLADVDGVANQGAAYVYTRTEDGWALQDTLLPDDGGIGTLFGQSVAIDGDTIVVGALGAFVDGSRQAAAYVYVADGDAWSLQDRLSIDESWSGDFGSSVAVGGDTILVGAPNAHIGDNNVQGTAYAFTWDGQDWVQEQQILASDGRSFANFGTAIAMDGSTAVITAPAMTVADFREGAAYVFEHTEAGWTEQARLTASDAAVLDEMGTSADIAGDTILIGAATADIGGVVDQGAAYVYGRSGQTWAEQAKLTVPGSAGDRFGQSVALETGTAVVGASHYGADPGFDRDRGAAFVFDGGGETWARQITLVASDSLPGDLLGTSVSASGPDVVVGAPGATVDGRAGQGTAYVFTPSEPAPVPPTIEVTSEGLNPVVEPDATTTGALTLTNTGEQDLTWAIGGEAGSALTGLVRPSGPGSEVETSSATTESSDGAAWAASGEGGPSLGGEQADAMTAVLADEDVTTLTHSASMDIVSGHTVVCADNQDGTTRENRGLRTFVLDDFGVAGDFAVSEVTFGVENVTVQADLTVNLYTLDGTLTYDNVTRIASETVTLDPQSMSLVTVPITATVPAGATLVAEVVTPDLQGVGRVYLGSNDAGETAPSYISSEPCGTPNPATFESLGFPNVHLVMAVSGVSVEPISCELPDWLAVDPTSGLVAPGEQATVGVTFDTVGLAVGEYGAHLCVTSNDPATPMTAVPVTLTVVEPFELTASARRERGDWYADLAWSGATSAEVDVYRDGELVATVASADDGTGTHTDAIGKPGNQHTVTYQVCAAGADPLAGSAACTDPVVLHLRGNSRAG